MHTEWGGCVGTDDRAVQREGADTWGMPRSSEYRAGIWVQLAQTYYAIESIKATDKLHLPLFEAIHKSKTLNPQELVRDPKSLFDWVATKGWDRKKFVDAYSSFSVLSHAKRTIDFTSRYDITGTPTLVIDGRYLTSPSMLPPNPNGASDDYKPFFKVVDQVINMAKKNHGLK